MRGAMIYTTTTSIERKLSAASERQNPPDAIVLSSPKVKNRLLAVNLQFLESGQTLPLPGCALAGAVFNPGWGFSQAEIAQLPDGSAEFRLPNASYENLDNGDVYGYRVCPIDDRELGTTRGELRNVRRALSLAKGVTRSARETQTATK